SDFIPMIFLYSGKDGDLASIRTKPGNLTEQLNKLEEVYRSTFPNGPFDYFFMDQEYEKQYRSDERFREVFSYLTGFAILIACIGLFGLVSFTVAKRAREIGIRKVLGAEVSSIISLLAREFIWLIVIASAVAIPLTYVLLGNWLEQFANHIDLHWWLLILPALLVIAVAGLTILSQTYQIATNTPIKSLREE
ncbi:MAG: FtsX-like permease family protein, partial [Bacteroidota bacterium]